MTPPNTHRPLVLCVLALSIGAALALGATRASEASGTVAVGGSVSVQHDWQWPVARPHAVVGPFEAPATRYTAGHRGIDIGASAGAPAVAPADGVVSFVGVVVDRPLLSIRHGDGLVSTVEPVTSPLVVGQSVARGSPVGAVASGGHCTTTCLHLGVRLDGEYINPLLLLGEVPPAVLLPLASDSGPRVSRAVTVLDAFERHVGVDLGCAEARMAEELLHGAEVRSAVEEMCGGGVPECVRPSRAPAGNAFEQFRDERVHRPRTEASTSGAEEDGPSRVRASCEESWPGHRQVVDDRRLRRHTERHDSFLVALAGDAGGEAVEIEVVEVQPAEFRDAER